MDTDERESNDDSPFYEGGWGDLGLIQTVFARKAKQSRKVCHEDWGATLRAVPNSANKNGPELLISEAFSIGGTSPSHTLRSIVNDDHEDQAELK